MPRLRFGPSADPPAASLAPLPHAGPQPPVCLAARAAGKPALVVPCVPSSDQPFWADLVARRGLGPPGWFPGVCGVVGSGGRSGGPSHRLAALLKQHTAAPAWLDALLGKLAGPAADLVPPPHPPLGYRCAVRQLSAERLAAGMLAGLRGLRAYTAAAEELSIEMAQEQEGVEAAAAIVEAAALA